ncbi:hypothetical protein CRG98_039347 [Punica granatum]|uniref:Uncharacterized protein n=1 Tax=Punica granatum TaxID=22663 RepID=A0A2I0I8D7_PUNGR|nr:hypothetical protein CRG98_039347 [Punica granatum]
MAIGPNWATAGPLLGVNVGPQRSGPGRERERLGRRIVSDELNRPERAGLLGVAATAREDTGDGSEHRLGYAMLGMGFTGVDMAGIEGKSRVFRRDFPKSPTSQSSETRANFLFFLVGSCSFPPELTFYSFNFNSIPFSVKILVDLAENRGNPILRILGWPGITGSR